MRKWPTHYQRLNQRLNKNNYKTLKSKLKSDHRSDERIKVGVLFFSPTEWTADSSLDNEQNGIISWHLMNTLRGWMLNASGDKRRLLFRSKIVRLSPKSPDKVTQAVIKRTNQHHGQQHTFIAQRGRNSVQKKKLWHCSLWM